MRLAILAGSGLMIFFTWAFSIFATNVRKSRSEHARRSRRTVAVERIADTLFYRPAGVAGTLGRLGLLAVVAVISYFIGAGFGALAMKAPVPVALIIGAVLLGWAPGDPDTD